MSNEALSYTIADAVRVSGIGRSVFYELMATKRIAAVKVGKRTLIPAESLRAYLASLPAADIRVPTVVRRRAARAAA